MSAAGSITRRRALLGVTTGALATIGGGLELVSRGILPGRHLLDQIDGACEVSAPPERSVPAGPQSSGSFYSRARGREVGYTIAYPPEYAVGAPLPFALVLHAFGGDHTSGYAGLTLAQALATQLRGAQTPRPPIALVAADGGPLYWNPHPGDDPIAMLVDELIPLCARLGLHSARVGVTGISMGGYGALLLGERHPQLVAAVAAISPAIWTTYAQARGANAGAYASAADFSQDDVVAHAAALAAVPARVAAGSDDPFLPGVQALVARLDRTRATVVFTSGCHDGDFFSSQRSASLDFVAAHLPRGH